MMSTIAPSIVLVLVLRNVKGTPVGVEPTLTTVWASAGALAAMASEEMNETAIAFSLME